ncbi:MAG: hypothetical protein ACJ763_18540 [Bdellovibrionia bacterium]
MKNSIHVSSRSQDSGFWLMGVFAAASWIMSPMIMRALHQTFRRRAITSTQAHHLRRKRAARGARTPSHLPSLPPRNDYLDY